jgi:hypothetical protein
VSQTPARTPTSGPTAPHKDLSSDNTWAVFMRQGTVSPRNKSSASPRREPTNVPRRSAPLGEARPADVGRKNSGYSS